VRGSDTVARLGGDEFVVLAADLDERDAVRPVIDKVSDVIGIPVSAGGGAWSLSASIGVAFYPDDAQTLDDLLKLADRAMYSDKVERKRRGVHFPTKP
jgi:diguanylate cyclase (GGDEF)-like protein